MNPLDASGNKYVRISTNGVTFIPKCVLVSIVINTKGSSSNTIKLYDSTQAQGADPQKLVASIDSTVVPGPFRYELPMINGLNVVTATGTPADITVVYRTM